MFSSATEEWGTPVDLFLSLDRLFSFNLDPCASDENHKCERYFTKEDDGLSQHWDGVVFMNPPYGRGINAWVQKAYDSRYEHGSTVVCLVPARTDARWFQFCFEFAQCITFLPGRLKFTNGECENAAPFPSALVVFASSLEAAKYEDLKEFGPTFAPQAIIAEPWRRVA